MLKTQTETFDKPVFRDAGDRWHVNMYYTMSMRKEWFTKKMKIKKNQRIVIHDLTKQYQYWLEETLKRYLT